MKKIDRILLSLDIGEATDAVVSRGCYLARCFDADVMLIHAMEEVANYQKYIPFGVGEELKDRVASKIEQIAAAIVERGVSVCHTLVSTGAPEEVIRLAVENYDINMIVMGAARKSFIERIWGSTAEKVIGHVAQPTWFVHPEELEPDIDSVVCAVDFSEASRETLEYAVHFCEHLNAHLTILHVFAFDPAPTGDTNVWPYYFGVNTISQCRSENDGVYEEYLKGFDLSHVRYSRTIRYGNSSAEIVKAVESSDCDLLIAGVHKKEGSSWFPLRGTIETVLRQVPCALMTVNHNCHVPDAEPLPAEAIQAK